MTLLKLQINWNAYIINYRRWEDVFKKKNVLKKYIHEGFIDYFHRPSDIRISITNKWVQHLSVCLSRFEFLVIQILKWNGLLW